MKHFEYLKYIVRHKWYVFVAGRKLKVSLIQLIVHDWHKFLPTEWMPYVEYFYGDHGAKFNGGFMWEWTEAGNVKLAFDKAWLSHIHFGKHHWQHWILREDSGKIACIEMPDKYVVEMVADWMGAGRAITGKWEVESWFVKNASNMLEKQYVSL